MTNFDIARARLRNQHITHTPFKKSVDVVSWLGAVQAQDYLGALWAIGLRIRNSAEKDIEQALAHKEIIRTWPMRGTLHFVSPADVRWMLQLLTPRVMAGSARRLLQQYDLTDVVFARSKELFQDALQGRKQLSRAEMYNVLNSARISTANQRGLQILWRLAQEGVICFGARKGKQQMFVLLNEWVPPTRMMERDEALAELATRYFTSHGPATLNDFVWWSGLAIADARAGLEMAKPKLGHAVIDGQTLWFSSPTRTRAEISHSAYLLPSYDENIVGYKDRTALFDPRRAQPIKRWNNLVFNPTVVIDGRIVGTWKRTFEKDQVFVAVKPFTPLTKSENRAVAAAVDRYAAFLDAPVVFAK